MSETWKPISSGTKSLLGEEGGAEEADNENFYSAYFGD